MLSILPRNRNYGLGSYTASAIVASSLTLTSSSPRSVANGPVGPISRSTAITAPVVAQCSGMQQMLWLTRKVSPIPSWHTEPGLRWPQLTGTPVLYRCSAYGTSEHSYVNPELGARPHPGRRQSQYSWAHMDPSAHSLAFRGGAEVPRPSTRYLGRGVDMYRAANRYRVHPEHQPATRTRRAQLPTLRHRAQGTSPVDEFKGHGGPSRGRSPKHS